MRLAPMPWILISHSVLHTDTVYLLLELMDGTDVFEGGNPGWWTGAAVRPVTPSAPHCSQGNDSSTSQRRGGTNTVQLEFWQQWQKPPYAQQIVLRLACWPLICLSRSRRLSRNGAGNARKYWFHFSNQTDRCLRIKCSEQMKSNKKDAHSVEAHGDILR